MKQEKISRKVVIIYALLTIIPLLVSGYIIAKYIFPYNITTVENLFLIFLLVLILSIFGVLLLMKIGKNIEIISLQTQKLASGEKVESIELRESGDEVETLAVSLNSIVQRIENESLALQTVTTQLEYASKELARQKGYTDRIINNMADTLFVIDSETMIKTVNNALLNLLGYEKKELLGKSIESIISEEKFSFFKNVKPILENGTVRNQDMFYIAKDGTKIPMSFSGSLLLDEGNNPTGIIGVARDMRELKKLLADLENANRELDRLSKVKSVFISNVSHELRTPLSIAKEGISQVLEGIKGEINPEQSDFLSIVSKNIDRLSYLIENLLDLSRIESGKVKVRRRLTDIPPLIKDVVFSFHERAREKSLEIRDEIPLDLPSVYIDPEKITQVLTNLIDNSLKFTKEGWVKIFAHAKKDEIEVSVLDTGAGIPQEYISGIFDRFQRFSYSHLPKESGLGLGLPIAKEIIDIHKGKIWAESLHSPLSCGSKLTFTIPIYNEEGYFLECLSDGIEYAKDEKTDLSLIMVQIKNNFPSQILIQLEKTIEEILRKPADSMFKYKGAIAILAFTDKNGALSIGKRIKIALETKISFELKIATYPSDGITVKELIQRCEPGKDINCR
ncbi:hypothetical protein AUJ66_03715 [Candidatus Desantisbacteria bacterium CG1_02_38_46]|uniref:histidine kinase n=2 Tax=unclassified Candidatus Desantisiibacteriota TaxID=3106372 RepID=A0A2H9PDA7_9BACT|nr:MAG: hypothetical protein AUJ66_03715 [Candidatus Desantisbacteria bacterium CG1_02_38_46]PIZ17409.1 MAG: hypothetical protein COY51_00250 [Candidatus Desantisbacteria bacterium CG_4_10_14_0_8_um_filter_39_17]